MEKKEHPIIYPKFSEEEQEFKKDWIEALRSGKYRQGTGELATFDRDIGGMDEIEAFCFCCLGVGCMVKGGNPMNLTDRSVPKKYDKLPLIITDTSNDNSNDVKPVMDKLITMNDGIGNETVRTGRKSFLEIADWIEENL